MRGQGLIVIVALLAGCGAQPAPPSRAAPCASAGVAGTEIVIPAGRTTPAPAFELEERAPRGGAVAAFRIDAAEVTNRQYAAFVAATGYRTMAEREGPDGARLGGAVFDRATGFWRLDPAADWRHPTGTGSTIDGREDHPVVQVGYEDARAYAEWAKRRLPTEAEWERAARGDAPAPAQREAEAYAPGGAARANTWQGAFPIRDDGADAHIGTAPVGCFAPNALGLYDMVGNVWEWTSDWYAVRQRPTTEAEAQALDPEGTAKRVLKGGSHLCAPNFCARYRTASRQPGDPGMGTSHIGFRTVADAP